LSWYTTRTAGRYLIGREVYIAQAIARKHDDQTHTLYLGDSVARQVFPPGEETDKPFSKYITTNQAISVAGQYYLLREALESHPAVKTVYLFYTPNAWGNNLDQVYTHDYFCGYFHKPEHVKAAFAVKKDWSLLGVHLGRMLLPNVAAANSSMSIAHAPSRANWVKEAAAGKVVAVPVSPVSEHFLAEMRALCQSKGIQFKVYPCPVSEAFTYRDDTHLYDAPIEYFPADAFQEDAIHLKRPYVTIARAKLDSKLPMNTEPAASVAPTEERAQLLPTE
jgi:hypothetical protein